MLTRMVRTYTWNWARNFGYLGLDGGGLSVLTTVFILVLLICKSRTIWQEYIIEGEFPAKTHVAVVRAGGADGVRMDDLLPGYLSESGG
jgi:hypothetical protein